MKKQEIQENVKNINQEFELSDFQKKALEEAEKKLENIKKEIAEKKYLVNISVEDIDRLIEFISKHAPWKFTECLGIVEVLKELKIAKKEKKLFCGALPIEAIYYYLSKVESIGKELNIGFSTIEEYIKVLKEITSTVERIKLDNEKIRRQEFIVGSRREGIEPAPEIDMIEEE